MWTDAKRQWTIRTGGLNGAGNGLFGTTENGTDRVRSVMGLMAGTLRRYPEAEAAVLAALAKGGRL